MFDFEHLEREDVRINKPLVVHEDALDAAVKVACRSIDQLLWSGSPEVARAVTLFGAGGLVLPVMGRVSGVEDCDALTYTAHPRRAERGGLMDRADLEAKFGRIE